LILWNAKSGREVRRFRGHQNRVECVAFLPDGRHAVSTSLDRTIRLWNLSSGQEVDQFHGNMTALNGLAVSPDGCRLLSSSMNGHELQLWDVETRKLVHRMDWEAALMTRGSFAPDGVHAVWAGDLGIVRMFRLPAAGTDRSNRPAQPTAGR
jgi:WD40 repeat protein